MQRYPKYKSSNVNWLGDVPEHWIVENSKWLFELRNERARLSDEQLTASQKYGMISQKRFMELENQNVMQVLKNPEILKHIEAGDFVISMRSFQGGLEYSHIDGAVSSAYVALIPRPDLIHDFYRYLFKSPLYIQALQSTSNLVRDGQALRYNNFIQVRLPLPPPNEQFAIARFLEREICRIDTLISEKQNFINLLEEKRQALISHVVTKGLDDSVEMKGSGVEWIGKVPAHWTVMRLKHVSKLNAGTKKKQIADDEEIEFLPMSNVNEVAGEIRNFDMRKYTEVSSGYTTFQTNDVIFAKITPCMENGNCVLVPELKHGYGFGSTEFIVFRANRKFLPEYLFYVLRNKELRKICETFMTGTAGQQRISTDFLAEFPVAVPSIDEQKTIVEHIRKNNARLYELKQETIRSIALLKEHRSALISAAVTGKIDVREEA